MACDGYKNKALMGNWYEDRLAPKQTKTEQPELRIQQPKDQGILFSAPNGQLKFLNRVQRAAPWSTLGVIPDDGAREYRSGTNTNFDQLNLDNFNQIKNKNSCIKTNVKHIEYPESNQVTVQVNEQTRPKMLHVNNMYEITENQREVQQQHSDFHSTFRKHSNNHQQFYGTTTNQQMFLQQSTNNKNQFNYLAGANERPIDQCGAKMTSVVGSEKYKDFAEPKDNSFIQRAWLPQKDKGLMTAKNNIQKNQTLNTTAGLVVHDQLNTYRKTINQVKPDDLATSLPINVGVHSLIKAQSNYNFRHVRTDVTMIRNQSFSKR